MVYAGRPGVSPAVAALIAVGRIHRTDRILDVGCGTGTDALTLARWGFRQVVGIDPDRRAIGTARSRARRTGLADVVRFEALPAEDLAVRFGRRRFHVALHTLVANNLRDRLDEHFENVHAVLRRGGLLVLHERLNRQDAQASPGEVTALDTVRRRFRLTPGLTTQLAERPALRGPAYARVALWLGTPR